MASLAEIQKQNLQRYITQNPNNQDAAARLQAWNTSGSDPGSGYKAPSQPTQPAQANATNIVQQNPMQKAFDDYYKVMNSGFGDAESLARNQASRLAQEKKGAYQASLQNAATNRDVGLRGVESSLADAKQRTEETAFQQYLASRQNMANRGLSGQGLAKDEDTRLQLAHNREILGHERNAADRRYAIDQAYNDQSKALYDQMGQVSESDLYNELFAQYRSQAAQEQSMKAQQLMSYINAMNQQQQQELDNQFRQDQFGLQKEQFQYGQEQDSLNRREADKNRNLELAQWFTQNYGVPVAPKESYQGLLNQVQGIKPLKVQEFEEDKRRFGLNYALEQQAKSISAMNAQTSRMSANNSASNANFNRMMDIWKATGVAPSGISGVEAGTPWYQGTKTTNYNYKTDPDFAEDVGSVMTTPEKSLQMLTSNAQRFIQKYGYEGYQDLMKAARSQIEE